MDATLLLDTARAAAAAQQYPAGALYVVGTPIGNLADLSLRAIHVLELVDVVACEDTRMTQRLLQHLGLSKKLMAVHEHNENQAAEQVVQALQAGQRVAYVSDAGTPAVSDPGARLVQAVQAAGLRPVPIPGASAVVSLLSVAGDTAAQGFAFVGFLPPKSQARMAALKALQGSSQALVFFESPHRVDELARDLALVDPDRTLTVGRELTKQFEDVVRMPASQWPAWLKEGQHARGEFAVVWHARPPEARDDDAALPAPVLACLSALAAHHPVKEAARLVAELTGLPGKQLYQAALASRQHEDDHDDQA
jgi:16S rRNA (cytidine1402-2'-O)-methyltransferase